MQLRSLPLSYGLGLALAASVASLDFQKVHAAANINFGAWPDGSLASANNPYGGILEIQAKGGTDWLGEPGQGTSWTESTIVNGVLEVMSLGACPPNTAITRHWSLMTATFSEPVIDVHFDAWCYREATYSYVALNTNGVSFSGSGVIPGQIDGDPHPPTLWVTFTPNIPDGGYLTEFAIRNDDWPSPLNGAFWVNNISFSNIIPEPSTLALASLGAAVLMTARRRR